MDQSKSDGWCFAIPETILKQVIMALLSSGVLRPIPKTLIIETEITGRQRSDTGGRPGGAANIPFGC